jgi:nitrile hydratase subunit beta
VNGIHDMGGMHGMGPIQPEKNELVFHAAWEGRAFALSMAVDGDWPYGADRYATEVILPEEYLRQSYYEKWITSLVDLMLKSGMVTAAEIETGRAIEPNTKKGHVLTAAEVPPMIAAGGPASRNVPAVAHFRVGQRVQARNINPVSHTRLPRYARGKIGMIERDHGVFEFPDTSAQGLPDKPQHVYSVRFAARELWGEQASPQDSVYIDMWDDYLEPA